MTTYATHPNGTHTITAAEALLANRFVKSSGAYADANEIPIGVTDEVWASGDAAKLITGGIANVYAANAVTAGEPCKADADGTLSMSSIVSCTTIPVVGIALQTTAQYGLCPVKLWT